MAKFEQKAVVAGKSKNTLIRYFRRLAKLAILYNQLSTKLDPYRVSDYLQLVKRGYHGEHKTVGREGFLQMMYFLPSFKFDY